MQNINEIIDDCRSLDLPKDDNAFDKISCHLEIGDIIHWYYEEDLEFCREEGLDPKDYNYYSGLVVPIPDIEVRGKGLDIEDAMIAIIDYPCEKSYPESDWIALNRLLDNEDLVEIYK